MTGTAGKSEFKPVLWTPGDWNAFFGFGTNILVNMLVLTGLLRFVLKMPDSLVFGRILPALGLMMCLSTFYYAFLAYRLAVKTGALCRASTFLLHVKGRTWMAGTSPAMTKMHYPPLTAPAVSPATICRWANTVSSSTGSVTISAAAASGPQLN